MVQDIRALVKNGGVTMVQDIRGLINDRLAELGWSRYRLAEAVDGRISAGQVYGFLAGRCDISSARLALLLDEVGLDLVKRE